jgi:hypothetical protein
MLRTENLSQDVMNAQVASNALVKLIRKLRWVGMAERVQRTVLSLEALARQRGSGSERYRLIPASIMV